MKSIMELMQNIKDHDTPRYLAFFGDEYKVMQIYTQKIIESEYEQINVDSVAIALRGTSKKSLVSKPKCYVVVDDENYIKQEDKWIQVKETFEHSKNMLLLKYNKLDKRSKFFKQNEDSIVEFEKLSDNVLLEYLSELNEDIALDLIHICDNNYGRILLELDKINHYSGNKSEVCKQFIKDGIIHQDIGDITFLLTDAIMTGDMDKVNKYLYQAKLKEEPAIMILSILYDNFKNMLIIQGLGNEKPTEENTGLKNGQIWTIKKKCGAYSNKELLRNLKIIRDAEVSLKSGRLDSDIALDYVITNIVG